MSLDNSELTVSESYNRHFPPSHPSKENNNFHHLFLLLLACSELCNTIKGDYNINNLIIS